MSGLLAGKSVLITGGGGGIGRATASAFAREGAHLAIVDLTEESLGQTVEVAKAYGAEAIGICADVSKPGDVQAMVETTIKAYGRLDCAFNNAGLGVGQLGLKNTKLADWPEEVFDHIIRINLKGVWLCMKHELARMVAQGSGAIINTSSIAGLVGVAGTAGYNASKHGIIGLTKTAALEYAGSNIRVNAICPGVIHTKMTAATDPERLMQNTPMARQGTTAEIAETVLYLCSDRAAFITGTSLAIDGGWTAQ